MSRPTITTFLPGEDERNAALISSAFASFTSASADVDEENVAEEGLDERSMADKFASELLVRQANSGPTNNTNTAFATTNIGGNFRTSGFTVPSGYKLKITASMTFASTAAQAGIDSGRYVTGRLAYSIAAVVTPITNTTRYVGEGVGPSVGQGGDLTTGTVLPAGTYDWIEMQSMLDAAGTYRVGYGTIIGELYYTG